MTKKETKTVTRQSENSIENVLGVPSGTTEIEETKVNLIPVEYEEYDDKDRELEEDYVDIQERALELYETVLDKLDDASPDKIARLVEVATAVLNTSLTAVEKRRIQKEVKDKILEKQRSSKNPKRGGNTTNNIVVGTHSDLISLIAQAKEAENIIEHDDYEGVDDEQ